MTLKPCLDCGELGTGPRCNEHAPSPARTHALSATRRGYDAAWRSLSVRARRLQRFCSDCGATEDLTVDHSPEAWQAKANGRAITLDLVNVVCRSCNGKRGRARPVGGSTPLDPLGPPGEGNLRDSHRRDQR